MVCIQRLGCGAEVWASSRCRVQNLSKPSISGPPRMRYAVLSAACLCSVMMCSPASAQGWRGSTTWSRIFSSPKPNVPRYPRPDLSLRVGYAAGRFAEWHRLPDRDSEDAHFKGLDVSVHATRRPWLLGDTPPELPAYLGPEPTIEDWGSRGIAADRDGSAELRRQIDAAVAKYLDQVCAIHGEAARNLEEIRIAGVAHRAKRAVWLESRTPTPAAIGFPPQNVRHDPFSGGLIPPRW